MKKRPALALGRIFILLYAFLGAGCFWRERPPERDVHVEHHGGDHGEHEHEQQQHQQHEERRDNERR